MTGGTNGFIELVPKGGQRSWSLDVDADSLQRFLPDKRPHEVVIVAAFSELQHDPFSIYQPEKDRRDALFFESSEDVTLLPLLLRSNSATARWTGDKWQFPATPASRP